MELMKSDKNYAKHFRVPSIPPTSVAKRGKVLKINGFRDFLFLPL
ncbi:hypothetical protein BN938_2505 [Mucinivorans hirudinis]|uniref:Uncharacterized protein n=1 Tax=Mucinivorans hirudinis TaxID=1433126 RepID=A0A060RAC0_9BACT|nr:hypothetical protein BN938_2505 [Mucinivorans hirudinis]